MNSTFRLNSRMLGSLLVGGLLAFTPNQISRAADEKPGKVVIRGSNTIGEELTPQLIAEYKKTRPEAAFDLEFKGSAYGIGNLLGGVCDLAGSSKPLMNEQEEIGRIRGVQFKEYVLGSYTVAILVNAANPISNLSTNQVQALFTGSLKNWKDVGGPDAPVQVYARDPISGTYLGFKELAMANQSYAAGEKVLPSYQEIADAVAKDPNGIGYCGLNLVTHPGAKAVSIDGIAPTAANINSKKYPYARTLRFYTNGLKETPETKKFIEFILSSSGQATMTSLGYAPKP